MVLLGVSLMSPLYAANHPALDLNAFVGAWQTLDKVHPNIQRVLVSKIKQGYRVQVWGHCDKQASCDWGNVTLSNHYPHGLKPWNPKHKIAFVAFKKIAPNQVGMAILNVFDAHTHQKDKMLITMLSRH